MDINQKVPRPVEPFQVKVLGGEFQVSEVLVDENTSNEQTIATITTTPEERWFVMAGEEREDQKDALAIIDDNMEFQIMAFGILTQH